MMMNWWMSQSSIYDDDLVGVSVEWGNVSVEC